MSELNNTPTEAYADAPPEKSWQDRVHDMNRKTSELRSNSDHDYINRLIQELRAMSGQAESLRKAVASDNITERFLLEQLDRSIALAVIRIADVSSKRLVDTFNQLISKIGLSTKPLTVISQMSDYAMDDARTMALIIKDKTSNLYQEIPQDSVLEEQALTAPIPRWKHLLQRSLRLNVPNGKQDSRASELSSRQKVAEKQKEAIDDSQETFREFSLIIDSLSKVKTNIATGYDVAKEMRERAKKAEGKLQ